MIHVFVKKLLILLELLSISVVSYFSLTIHDLLIAAGKGLFHTHCSVRLIQLSNTEMRVVD
jgi:hypothetical protein